MGNECLLHLNILHKDKNFCQSKWFSNNEKQTDFLRCLKHLYQQLNLRHIIDKGDKHNLHEYSVWSEEKSGDNTPTDNFRSLRTASFADKRFVCMK